MSIPTEKIIEAASKAGFDSELRVALMLSKAGWQVNQNVYFLDKDEGKGRELDIEAYRIFSDVNEKPQVSLLVELLIEVKKTRDPFIFFTSNPRAYEGGRGYGLFHWMHNVNSTLLTYQEIERRRPLSSPGKIARSYCSMKDGKTQQISAGILSSFKAAVHYQEACEERYSDISRDIAFFMPTLVVDGEIFECYLDDASGELTASSSEALMYLQNYHSQNYGRLTNRVAVVTTSFLPTYLVQLNSWGEDILKTLQERR